MKIKLVSLFLAAVAVFSCVPLFSGCSDRSLESFEGELYVEILPVKDGKKGIITIVHDDGDYDTVQYMKTQFELYEGLSASLAIIANNVVDKNGTEKAAADKWRTLVDEGGFDIVCHTQSHTWYGFTDGGESGTWPHRDGTLQPYSYPAGHMTNEIAGAAERLGEVFGQKVRCYAIPGFPVADSAYNGRNQTAKDIIASNFVAARYSGGSAKFGEITVPCMNSIENPDFYQLNSWTALTTDDANDWIKYVNQAAEYGGWGIFLFHQMVKTETDYQYNVSRSKTTRLFNHLSGKVVKGDIWCATFTEAALYIQEYKSADVGVRVSGDGIVVSVSDSLDDYTYDTPLTVKVQVMDSWKKVKIEYDGEKLEKEVLTDESGMKYVLVDIIPDRGYALINSK